MASVRVVPNREGLAAFRRRIARGITFVMLDAETEAKRLAPVRGGNRSFHPGVPPIGGTLRRSIHSAVFIDGVLASVNSESVRTAATPPPPLIDMVGLPGRIVGYVGTNSGYGAFVDLGTRKMAARPFLGPGLDVATARAADSIRRGMA